MSVITEQEFTKNYHSDIWKDFAEQICKRHRISYDLVKRSDAGEHIVFFVDDLVIKIFAPFRLGFEREKRSLEFVRGKTSLETPELIAAGEYENFNYIIMTKIPGEAMTRQVWLTLPETEQSGILTQLATGLREMHTHDADSFGFDWHKFIEHQSRIAVQRQINAGVNPEWIEILPSYIETNLRLLPQNVTRTFLHGDVHFGNLRFQKTSGKWQISGLFDFADSLTGFYEFDFVAITLLMIQGQSKLQREFFKAYGHSESELNESLRKRLMLMTILYECSDLHRYALRLKPEALNFSFEELERGIWSFAD